MRRWCRQRWVAMAGVLLWSSGGISWAAAVHHADFNIWDELFRWVNFLVLAVVMYIIIAKILPRVLRDRRDGIQRAIEEAKAGRIEAQRLLQENEQKTANLQRELAELQQQAAQQRGELTQRIEAEAQQLAARIVAQARTEVERATERARLSLREDAAALTVQIAEEILQRELQDTDHQAIVRRYITRIGELN